MLIALPTTFTDFRVGRQMQRRPSDRLFDSRPDDQDRRFPAQIVAVPKSAEEERKRKNDRHAPDQQEDVLQEGPPIHCIQRVNSVEPPGANCHEANQTDPKHENYVLNLVCSSTAASLTDDHGAGFVDCRARTKPTAPRSTKIQ